MKLGWVHESGIKNGFIAQTMTNTCDETVDCNLIQCCLLGNRQLGTRNISGLIARFLNILGPTMSTLLRFILLGNPTTLVVGRLRQVDVPLSR